MEKSKSVVIKLKNLTLQDIKKIQHELEKKASKKEVETKSDDKIGARNSQKSVAPIGRITRSRSKKLETEFASVFEEPKASKRKLENKENDNQVAKKRKLNEPKKMMEVGAKPQIVGVGSSIDFGRDDANEADSHKTVAPIGRITRSRSEKLGTEFVSSSGVPKASKRKLENEDKENKFAKRQKLNESKKMMIVEAKPQIAGVDPSFDFRPNNQNIASNALAKIEFKINEVVWAKIKGHPHWPAKIKQFCSNKMVVVQWFADYRITKMYRSQLFKFLINYEEFSRKFKDHIGLEKAAKEALIVVSSTLK